MSIDKSMRGRVSVKGADILRVRFSTSCVGTSEKTYIFLWKWYVEATKLSKKEIT